MTSRYPIQLNSYVAGYNTAIENNQKNIIEAIKPHAKKLIVENDERSIIQEVINAAEWSVVTIPDNGPSKSEKDWKDAIKDMKKVLETLDKLNPIHFGYLDSALRQNDDTHQFLQYHSRFYVLPEGDVITLGKLHQHIVKSIMLWNNLLQYSLKGKSGGRPKGRNPLIQYCYDLHRIFEKYTDLPMTINSPYERFVWQCLEPLLKVTNHGYTEESVRKSIRALKKHVGAKKEEK
jgi:hypothetical protein